jgi:hypothetical protein
VLAAGAVLAFCTGCTKTTQGSAASPTIDKEAATAALWDPCTQIDSDTLQKLGVDQSTRESGMGDGVPAPPSWKICSWSFSRSEEQSIFVYSTTYTIDDFRKKQDNVDFVNITVGDRAGWKFHLASDTTNHECQLVFPATTGAYQVTFSNNDPRETEPPCDGVMKAANVLAPLFPR